MKVFGKEITPEHIESVKALIRVSGTIRAYQLTGYLGSPGFDYCNGQADRGADRILQRLKKEGFIRYSLGRWSLVQEATKS